MGKQMGKQSNFKTAVNELMNGKLGSDPSEDLKEEGGNTPAWEAPKKLFDATRATLSDSGFHKPSGNSVIAEDLIIEGSIYGDSTIQINGKVKGNVSITGDILARGMIEGDAKGNNITLNKSNVKGNVNATHHLVVDSESVVLGNLTATDIEVDGKVKGDIRAEEVITLKKSAVVVGNVSAKMVSMEAGAALKGQLNVLSGVLNDRDFKFEKINTSGLTDSNAGTTQKTSDEEEHA